MFIGFVGDKSARCVNAVKRLIYIGSVTTSYACISIKVTFSVKAVHTLLRMQHSTNSTEIGYIPITKCLDNCMLTITLLILVYMHILIYISSTIIRAQYY